MFFHGLAVGETNKVNIADGKTLVIKYLGLGDGAAAEEPVVIVDEAPTEQEVTP